MNYSVVFKKLAEAEGTEALEEAAEVASLKSDAEEAVEVRQLLSRSSEEEPTYFITT